MKHRLSPFLEKSLVALTALAGATAIYFAWLDPFVAGAAADIRSVPEPVTLDIDAWTRYRNAAYGYEYGVPPGWTVVDPTPGRVIVARGRGFLSLRDPGGSVMSVEARLLGPRMKPEDVAAAEFAGMRPALYDVAVDGREAVFAISFRGGRVADEAVYVPMGERVYVIRGGAVDPAVFSAFVSTVKFIQVQNP